MGYQRRSTWGQSIFSGSVEDTVEMRPFVALSFVLSAVCGAPTLPLLGASPYAAGAYATGAVTHSSGSAPAGHGLVPHGPVQAIHQVYAQPAAPAPYTTKQVHYGESSYVSGYNTRILKPATPHLPIQVPTVLKGTHTVNAPIIDEQVEIHNVQTPVLVERPVNIPYDAPFYSDNLVQVPVPVHVDAPYNAPFPVPVQG